MTTTNTQNTNDNFNFQAWKHHMVKFPETISSNQIDYLARLVSQYKIKIAVESLQIIVSKEDSQGKNFSKYLSKIESAIKAKKVSKRDTPADTRVCEKYVRSKLAEARSRVA